MHSHQRGVILSTAVLQAERRACPERSRRDLACITTALRSHVGRPSSVVL